MTRRPRRRVPPIWLWVFWLFFLVVMAWLWLTDLGDEGIRNAFSMILALGALTAGFLWFVFLSGYHGRLRATIGLGTVLAIGGCVGLARIEGFSGAMIPEFGLRFGAGERSFDGTELGALEIDLRRTTPDDFPGFLGRERDAFVRHVRLARDWEAQPPEPVWRHEIGAGWSGFAVVNGVAVTMEQRGESEAVTAYDVHTGALLWAHTYPGHFDHFLGGRGPRATPTIDEGRVYALGARGRLSCLDGATGAALWTRDLLAEYGVTPEMEARNVQYGRANSPLVAGDLVIVPAGGDEATRQARLAAFDKTSGEPVWESPPRQISFSSPRLATLAGIAQVLIVNEDTLSGHTPETGVLLWEHSWPGRTSATASVSQAVPVPPDRVFVSKGYGGGALLLELVPGEDGVLAAREVWRDRRALRTKLTNVVLKDEHIYGLSDGMLECVELETGRRVWKEGRYGHGQILRVDELLLLLSEEGEVVLIEPTPDEPDHILGRFQALAGKTWNNPALYGDLLVVRNGNEAAVYRLPTVGE